MGNYKHHLRLGDKRRSVKQRMKLIRTRITEKLPPDFAEDINSIQNLPSTSTSNDPNTKVDYSDSDNSENTSPSEYVEYFENENTQNENEINYQIHNESTDVEMEKNSVEGRRIFDVKYLIEQLKNFGDHELFGCSSKNMVFVKERRRGFTTSLIFKCCMCNKIESIESDRTNNEEVMSVNDAMVFGNICTGQSFSQMEERCALLNMPTMSPSTYFSLQKSIHDKITEVAMEDAVKIEKELAIRRGSVDKNGIPLLTVIVDGSWAKRSYKCNYSSLSGVACIVGFHSEKILFLSVRNTFCLICSRNENKEHAVPEHVCYKNWAGTANSMEADIIAEGFKQSVPMHGVKYTSMIGDGDSSVFDKLNTIRPYGIDQLVKKIECTNHICRNFNNRMKELSKNRINDKGVVPINMRKIVEKNLERLRISLYCIIKKRSKQYFNSPNPNEVKNEMILDLHNLLNHVFGCHDSCSSRQFQCKRKDNDINYINDLQLCGLWDGLKKSVRLVAQHVDSLLHNVNNNLAERYNSVVAKFVGGKRCNFVMRDSYEVRCKAAAASFNDRSKFHTSVSKKMTKRSPSAKYLKSYASKIKRTRELKCKRKLKLDPRTANKNKKRTTGPDVNYGRNHTQGDIEMDVPDMNPEIYNLKVDEFLKQLKKNEIEVGELERDSRGQSLNAVWISERLKRVTASNFGRICKLRDKTPRSKTVINMLYKKFSTSSTKWGKDHEAIALEQIRGKLAECSITECGFFVHQFEPYFGASPDGLVGSDGIIEIKCPFAARDYATVLEATKDRKVTGCSEQDNKVTLKTNSDYYYQIQGQLEVTNKNFCLFCVWIPNDLVIQKIERDRHFWNTHMKAKLKIFYFDHLLPEIIDSRFNRNKELR